MGIEILVPGRFIDTKDPVPFGVTAAGFFTIASVKPNGSVSKSVRFEDTNRLGPFNNLILDQGLNFLADTSPTALWNSFFVGTGTSPPQPTNTTLGNPIGGSITATRSSFVGVPPLYESRLSAEGLSAIGAFGNANLTEIGIGKGSGELFSRALIVDASGNPTAFPISEDEQLRVSYDFFIFPPLEDAVHEVNVNGLRQATVRALRIGSNSWRPSTSSAELFEISAPSGNNFYAGGLNDYTATNPLGGSISGSTNGSAVDHPYVSNSFKRSHRRSWRSTDGDSSEFRTQVVTWGTPCFQVQYDPPLAKNSEQTMFLEYEIAWGRR